MVDVDALQQRILQLEEVVSHQQHLLEQLTQVIVQLRKENDDWRRKLDLRVEQLETQPGQQAGDLPHEKPPHY